MKKFVIILFALLLTLSNGVFSQYTNFRIHPSPLVQFEPTITKSRSNQQLLFASSYTVVLSGNSEQGIYFSTNGGANWNGVDSCLCPPYSTNGGDPGPIIDKNNIFILTHLGPSGNPNLYSNNSTDMGNSWETNSLITLNNLSDKGSPATDDFPSSPFFGRSYVAWTFGTSPFNVEASYTTNEGNPWSSHVNVNNGLSNHISFGPVLTTVTSGNVYATWAACDANQQLVESNIGFAVSTDGGVTWIAQESAYACHGIHSTQFNPPWNIIVNSYPQFDVDRSGGPRNGWIYIVEAEVNNPPAGSDADVIMHYSTNGGTNWSAGIRVNQDPLNNGRVQFFPVVAVDDNGGVNVVYYDNRNTADSCEVWLSHSTDGGTTWHDYLVSDHRMLPGTASGFGPGHMGDHIGMVCANNKLLPVWMDNRNSTTGVFQIYSTIIDANAIGIRTISTNVPSGYALQQNYPNPFNPSTKIRFSIPPSKGVRGMTGGDFAQIKIYDILGREVETILNQSLQPGTYEVEWNAANFPSGAYFYKLSSGNFSQSRKMVLMK